MENVIGKYVNAFDSNGHRNWCARDVNDILGMNASEAMRHELIDSTITHSREIFQRSWVWAKGLPIKRSLQDCHITMDWVHWTLQFVHNQQRVKRNDIREKNAMQWQCRGCTNTHTWWHCERSLNCQRFGMRIPIFSVKWMLKQNNQL